MKKRINFDQIVWLFVFGCFLGFIVETTFHLLKYHVLINKQGLLYGPFKPIYGFGIVLLTLFLYPLKEKKSLIIFLGGMIIGTAFEYFCSFVLEMLWGTYTWTYANFQYSISKRIYLPYSIFWGILSLFWIKIVYPKIEIGLKKINPVVNKVLVWMMTIFMIFNLIMTAIAVDRFSKRYNHIAPTNRLENWIDKTYNDDVIHKKFPKLRIIEK